LTFFSEQNQIPVIIAGGLNPENISEAIASCHPFGVDVSSGVETDGRKEESKIAKFVSRAKTSK
jgi:phosphoribosylanthranilate isomerase